MGTQLIPVAPMTREPGGKWPKREELTLVHCNPHMAQTERINMWLTRAQCSLGMITIWKTRQDPQKQTVRSKDTHAHTHTYAHGLTKKRSLCLGKLLPLFSPMTMRRVWKISISTATVTQILISLLKSRIFAFFPSKFKAAFCFVYVASLVKKMNIKPGLDITLSLGTFQKWLVAFWAFYLLLKSK